MSIASTLWQYHDELMQSFHIATINGILSTWRRCESLGTTPQEPDFIAGIVVESSPLIYSVLNSLLSRHKVSVSMTSVFCHQTPQVSFGLNPPAICELGDILFAYVHTPRVGTVRRNAILFQAKASAQQPYRIHSGDKNQLRLYMDWPDFIYTRSTTLTGQKRFITPKTPHSGAQYLLIDDRPPQEPMSGLLGLPGTYPIGCCMPDESLRDHNHLASELFNLFIFKTGRPFEEKATAAKKQDWSQVVWDILESGVKRSFNRKNSGRRQTPSTAGNTIQMLDGTSFAKTSSWLSCSTVADIIGRDNARFMYAQDNDTPPINRSRENNFGESEGGVSVVLIETSERELEE
jgi:hypothetical protein